MVIPMSSLAGQVDAELPLGTDGVADRLVNRALVNFLM
jgi:hypothetical protein